jgi:hypothetical protein
MWERGQEIEAALFWVEDMTESAIHIPKASSCLGSIDVWQFMRPGKVNLLLESLCL